MQRAYRHIVSVTLTLGLLLSSCMNIATLKGYPGPEQPEEELAMIRRDIFQASNTTTRVWISEIDPTEEPDLSITHHKGYPQATVLPGEHRVRGFLTPYTQYLGGLAGAASCQLREKEITFVAEAGRLYMLKAAFDPLFLEHLEERAQLAIVTFEGQFDFDVDTEVSTLPGGEEGPISTVLPDYYWFWIEDADSGQCVAGTPPAGD
jgi:hypothetical protein